MSQLYHVQLKASVSESFQLKDRIVHQLELTQILPEEEMLEILKTILEQKGFEEGESGKWEQKNKEGETLGIDLNTLEATLSLEWEKELATDVSVTGSAYDDRGAAKNDAQRKLQEESDAARSQLEAESKRIQRELSNKLEEGQKKHMREVNEILQQVYAESLKRRAGQLGDIMEIQEGTSPEGQYELTIHVSQ